MLMVSMMKTTKQLGSEHDELISWSTMLKWHPLTMMTLKKKMKMRIWRAEQRVDAAMADCDAAGPA